MSRITVDKRKSLTVLTGVCNGFLNLSRLMWVTVRTEKENFFYNEIFSTSQPVRRCKISKTETVWLDCLMSNNGAKLQECTIA
jgi:phosphoribosylformylglycinamidine (FGAM) synthase-like amidotransferase family enzyme